MCVRVHVCTPGDSRFKWVKVRLASYYCLHSCSYIITVNCTADREGERDKNRAGGGRADAVRWRNAQEEMGEGWRREKKE